MSENLTDVQKRTRASQKQAARYTASQLTLGDCAAGCISWLPQQPLIRIATVLCMSVLLFLASGGAVPVAHAQPSVELYTAFPEVKARPGETVTFPIDVYNNGNTTGSVNMEILKQPEDWVVTLMGESWEIGQVRVRPEESQSVRLQIEVPGEATEGSYDLALEGSAQGSVSRLDLRINVSEEGSQTAELTTQFPILQGPSDANFEFRVDLTNHSADTLQYALGADAPEGWQVGFSTAGEDSQIASVSLEPNASQGINVQVTPAEGAAAGNYDIPIRAVSGQGVAETTLTVEITGTYELALTTPSGRLNAEATAGRESNLRIQLQNNGTTEIHGITLSSTAPENWRVSFEEEQVDVLSPGETRDVNVTIRPDSNAITGDYLLTLSANAQETSTETEFRVMVKTSTLWGIAGVVIVLAVIAGVYWLFQRYGRR